jgi:hypothetical protein
MQLSLFPFNGYALFRTDIVKQTSRQALSPHCYPNLLIGAGSICGKSCLILPDAARSIVPVQALRPCPTLNYPILHSSHKVALGALRFKCCQFARARGALAILIDGWRTLRRARLSRRVESFGLDSEIRNDDDSDPSAIDGPGCPIISISPYTQRTGIRIRRDPAQWTAHGTITGSMVRRR